MKNELHIVPSDDLHVGKKTTLTVDGYQDKEIKSVKWVFDDVALTRIEGEGLSLTIEPILKGAYLIQAIVHYTDGKKEEADIELDTEKQIVAFQSVHEEKEMDVYREVILSNNYLKNDIPHFIKRNARYRGHRESEKVNFSHQEQLYDIRKNYEIIEDMTNMVNQSVDRWFQGENETIDKNFTISGEKVYSLDQNKTRYRFTEEERIRQIVSLMVKLNNKEIDPKYYMVDGNDIVIQLDQLPDTSGALSIEYTALLDVDDAIGIQPLLSACESISERIAELERRAMNHENAYK